MLECKGITKSFGALEVLKGVDISVHKGDVVTILGPSGSGKTTLIRCMNFLERADAGTITFDGVTYDFASIGKKEIASLRKKTAFVFQEFNLFLNMTAIQNVMVGLTTARKVPKEEAAKSDSSRTTTHGTSSDEPSSSTCSSSHFSILFRVSSGIG